MKHRLPILPANHSLLISKTSAVVMSNPSYSSKRRRLNQEGSTLSKPFKSPFRALTLPDKDCEGALGKKNLKYRENDPAAITERSSRLTTQPNLAYANKDPELAALQKQHTAALLQLTQLRRTLDTAQQALKIASSPSTTTDLHTLITKWRNASREAAEEVFEGAKDRINGMGGMRAWREQSSKRRAGWDDDEDQQQRRQPNLENLSETQKEMLEMRREEAEAERRGYAPEKVGEPVEGEEDDDDDVSPISQSLCCRIFNEIQLTHHTTKAVFHNGHDAAQSQHRARRDWLR
jgi:Swi5-dependent recombination DNA repair protein 1